MNSESVELLGSTRPRLFTAPLVTGDPGPCGCGCALTPETSYGFDVIAFARDVLGTPLDEWQAWLVIHAGELLPGGRPRFRQLLVLVSRQQGKTFLTLVLTLFWLFVEEWPMTLSTSTNRDYAKESWRQACIIAQANEYLSGEIDPKTGVRATIGEECLTTLRGARYKIAASNGKGGRSLAIDRLILDELREHDTFDAWNASSKATNAKRFAQIWAISNQGDEGAVVLDSLRLPALKFIESGKGDKRLGLFEWSAPDGSSPTDPLALAAANPNLGRRTDLDTLMSDAIRAEQAGGEELAGFLTEVLCMRVPLLNPAIDPGKWNACGTDAPTDLAAYRQRVAVCVDVSLDRQHATLAAAAVIDGKVHVEILKAWDGPDCTSRLRRELPGVVAKVRPRSLGWFPQGPAAAIAADLAARKGNREWPPRGTTVEEIRGELTAVSMGLAEQVDSGSVVHSRDPMLNAHIGAAQKAKRGEAWTFTGAGKGAIDGAYAVAGAVHLARVLPPAPAPLSIV